MKRTTVFGLLTVLLVGVAVGTAQNSARRTTNATLHPCPGGTGVAEVEGFSPGTVDDLVLASDLIVVGTVANVLPAFNRNPEYLSIETHSLVAADNLLYGILPSAIPSAIIALAQMGGEAGPCKLVVPADPLVQKGEQYIFFLRADKPNRVPDTSGLPRYVSVGVHSSKAKVVNGKIQFLPSARPGLHEYDAMNATDFIAVLQDRIKFFCERDLSFKCLLPRK